jgi:glycogen debranching enzyme
VWIAERPPLVACRGRGPSSDLTSLRVEEAGERFTAAGAPWFMALFGRDALLTGYAALPLGTGDVLDTLEALARRQGRRHDPRTLEQPGRILHELRTGKDGVFGLRPGEAYYGTTDATPLFVYLLAEVHRWGADAERVARLLPAARAAVTWCLEVGDVDGDGFVEAVPDPNGIENQGWKDSGDSMVHADGTEATPPIALAEVQAYVHGALTGLAELETRLGDPAATPSLLREADELARRYREAFWSPRLGGIVLGLDAAKQQLEVPTSNMGHALWTGILAAEDAVAVSSRVTAPDLFASWGIRTLGADEAAYSPLAYHRGTIWPHDTAIVAHGLSPARRHGRPPAGGWSTADAGPRRSSRATACRNCWAGPTVRSCRRPCPTRWPAAPRPGARPRRCCCCEPCSGWNRMCHEVGWCCVHGSPPVNGSWSGVCASVATR